MTIKRGILQVLLAALLLAVQLAALTHDYKHWRQGDAGVSQQHDSSKHSSKVRLCDFHGACAQVLGGVAVAAVLLGLVAQGVERSAGLLPVLHRFSLLAAHSRGPPVLL